MKNTKKLLSLVISALSLASVVGCGGGKGSDNVITIWVGAESVQFYSEKVEEYKNTLESIFGEGSVYVLKVRKYGAVYLDKLC